MVQQWALRRGHRVGPSLGGVTQIRSPVLLVLAFSGLPKFKRLAAASYHWPRTLMPLRIDAADDGAKMHDLTTSFE